MRSASSSLLPPKLRRALEKLGSDIRDARRKRRLTVNMMTERTGVTKTTYLKVEKGDPSVSLGVYAMALFALGLSDGLADLIDTRKDETGLLLESTRLPQRIRPKKTIGEA